MGPTRKNLFYYSFYFTLFNQNKEILGNDTSISSNFKFFSESKLVFYYIFLGLGGLDFIMLMKFVEKISKFT